MIAFGRAGGLAVLLMGLSVSDLVAADWGDYRGDYLLPEERDEPWEVYVHGSAGMSRKEETDQSGQSRWKQTVGSDSEVAIWLAGRPLAKLSYFGEALYDFDGEELRLGQLRVDMALNRTVAVRAGRFWFPFGIEMRDASMRVNRFLTRPHGLSRLANGVALLGEIGDGDINIHLAATDRYVDAAVDSMIDHHVSDVAGAPRSYGGRLGLSPRAGLEVGASYVAHGDESESPYETAVAGGDLSIHDGPLHIQAEAIRIERTGTAGSGTNRSLIFDGRMAYRIVEDSRHFSFLELMFGAGIFDPDENSKSDRVTTFLFGGALSPYHGLEARLQYDFRREQVVEVDDDLLSFRFLVFW